MPAASIILREVDLTGTWTGTYTIPNCWPKNSPNSCTWYSTPGSMTLTLTQREQSLTGTFKSDRVGTMAVSGSVDAAGTMSLSGHRTGITNCFSLGPIMIDVVARVEAWSTRIQRNGSIAGAFSQFTYQTLSSCYKTFFEYNTEVVELRRDAPPLKRIEPSS